MSVLDELREALDGDPNEAMQRQDIFDAIDAFEAAHPGLVDVDEGLPGGPLCFWNYHGFNHCWELIAFYYERSRDECPAGPSTCVKENDDGC